MSISRRVLAAVAGTMLAAAGATALAQDWKGKYPELVFAIVPAENAKGVTERYAPFVGFLAKELGTKVTLRVATDYAAVIEGQKAENIHIAMYGPASYARAFMVGAKTEPFAIEVNDDGAKGYYSVLLVKKGAPFQKIEDLKGKNLCLVDPNSTSGNNVPRFAMNKLGIVPESYFAKVVNAGSHENAVIAVAQGTCDGAFNWWNTELESNLKRMERKSMAVAGKAIAYADFHIIFKSDQIVNSPMAVLATLPADLKAAIRKAVFDLPVKDKAAFERIYEGKGRPWEPVDHKAYEPVVELVRFVDSLKKKN